MQNKITIDTQTKTSSLGDFYGIFFEDLNHAADGGLYAEIVRNRGFEFSPADDPSYRPLTGWEIIEREGAQLSAAIENKSPLSSKNPHYLMMQVKETGMGAGIMNLGYNTGLPLTQGMQYRFSCYAKNAGKPMTYTISLESVDGAVYASDHFEISSDSWSRYECTLTASQNDFRGRLVLTAKEPGKAYFDMISLFPANTFKQRENGMREDIAQLLSDLKPKFMRFPGGCLIHDGSLNADDRDSMYRWKNTIGPLQERPSRRNNWGYNQSLGIGYYEYFIFCEDIGAKPVPILPAAYNPHSGQGAAFDDLGEWIDDALDLIEFANGSPSTTWGKIRAELGHEEPFHLEYIGIGNEEVGHGFFDRYPYFHKAIKEKYPEIKIINSASPFAAGGEYDRGWASAREHHSDIIDEHYYMSPEWFLANHHRYDSFKADDPKVFLGEYASWGNTYYNALVEAAYMTGLENNAHAVALVCYAPLLCNTDYRNWEPDMIWFDNHRAFGSANYYVQKMFMNHLGTHLLKTTMDGFENVKKTGDNWISGEICLCCDGNMCDFYDVTLTDNETNQTVSYGDFKSTELSQTFPVGTTASKDYTLRLKVKKKTDKKGIRISFGKKDDKNLLNWVLGGWANGDNLIESLDDGRNSCLCQHMFSLVKDKVYTLELHVWERVAEGFINGEKTISATADLPIEEELYVTSSIEEETGEIIIKAVNVQDKPVSAQVVLEGSNAPLQGIVLQLAGYALEEENSFEQPDKIKPAETPFDAASNCFEYCFPKQSITIFRVYYKAGK